MNSASLRYPTGILWADYGRALAGVPGKLDDAHFGAALNPGEGLILRTIVDENEFVIDARERGGDLVLQFGDVPLLIVERDDDGDGGHGAERMNDEG